MGASKGYAGLEILKALLEHSTASGTRSGVLSPLMYLVGILFVGLLTAHGMSAPPWMVVGIAAAIIVCLVLLFIFYVYFALVSPDALRSERFNIAKLAIEQGMVGDDLWGWRHPAGKLIAEDVDLVVPEPETSQ